MKIRNNIWNKQVSINGTVLVFQGSLSNSQIEEMLDLAVFKEFIFLPDLNPENYLKKYSLKMLSLAMALVQNLVSAGWGIQEAGALAFEFRNGRRDIPPGVPPLAEANCREMISLSQRLD